MNSSLISKYIPLNTIIHNLDPRVKLFFVICYFIDVFIAHSVGEFLVLALFLILATILSKTRISFQIESVKAILLLKIFTTLDHLILNKSGNVIFEFYAFKIYSGAFYGIALITARFILVVMMMVVFMGTTSPSDITHAIEKSLGFLKKIGIPISTFALVLSISLRFIPTILEETNRIINAQVSRGSDFNEGTLIQKTKKFIPILIPLFIGTLKRADELATAMEVRGYSTTTIRSRYKEIKYNMLFFFSFMLISLSTIFIVIM